MGSSSVMLVLLVVLVALSLAVDGRSGCSKSIGCLHHHAAPEYVGRGISAASKEGFFKGFTPLGHGEAGEDHLVDWELRQAPSGPDPMHHHGSPKKPRTP